MRPILDVAADMGLTAAALELHGHYKAKVPLEAFPSPGTDVPLVIVTAMTPSPPGEGKTTTSIGLVDGLARIGRRPVLTLREPSMGPFFGIKGGGTGGGMARVEPEADINLHFTGDAHAVASAHNLLAAMTDGAAYHGTVPGLEASRIAWRRVTNAEERGLRRIVTGLGGQANGPMREAGFDIDAASEIMAILSLANGYDDLRERLARIVVGSARDRTPITASDIGAVGSMMALLKDSLKPNLAQTREGNPAVIHTGPFGNIAHGNSSILADRLAAACGDIVVTEAGFGADLGFEKFVHIKTRMGGHPPSVAVVVVTVRALKYHGGSASKTDAPPDGVALQQGLPNMDHVIGLVKGAGVKAVVAINRFPDDTREEVEVVRNRALAAGAHAVVESHGFTKGGEGTIEMAEAVVDAAKEPVQLTYAYDLEDSPEKKVEKLARSFYGASEVQWEPEALSQTRRFVEQGAGRMPICMAKTHRSISADPTLLGRPLGHTFPIVEMRMSAGAGFLVPLAGAIQTLPGLPRKPNALGIDLDGAGNVVVP
ncbi:MAG: formate--tetrahydrofolate ligase [Chloroflexi bacterium]|jgi:formate--tetrahydrofolate ligase|nr:MAG: formate--tetrahydrofolate ligase [Chloroflexota bacterium]